MNRRRAIGVLCLLFVVAFAANTLWLFPDGNSVRHEYRTVELDGQHAHRYIRQSPSVKSCVWRASRTCGFELAAIHGGVPVDVDLSHTYPEYEYISTRNGFYEPTVDVRNGTTIFTARSVSFDTVVSNVTYDPGSGTTRMTAELRKAIRTGHLRTRSEIPRPLHFLNDSGTYYYLQPKGAEPSHPLVGPNLFAIRVVLWLATLPLSVLGIVLWND